MRMALELKNRWWIVFASVLGLLVGNGPIMQFTFGTLLPPVSREFGWSRGVVSSAIVMGLWMTGLATPVVGRLVDRFGIRAVALPAIALFSAATASVAWVPASPAAFTALYALMGLGAAGQTPLIYSRAISVRFDDQRGLALGVAMAGVGLGAALVPQFARALIAVAGWRGAYMGLGLLTFGLAFPAVALFVGRPAPGNGIGSQNGPAATRPGLSGLEALRTGRFWLLALSFFIVSGTSGGLISHLVPLLTDRGVSLRNATGMVGIAGGALIGGRVFAGYLVDRIHGAYVAACFFFAPLVGIVVLLTTTRPEAAGVAALLVGLGLGAEGDLMAFLQSRYLGLRSFGEIYGYFFAIFMLGAGLGPFVMGRSFDRTGSYRMMLLWFSGALAVAILPMLRLGPYAYPVARKGGGGMLRAPLSEPTARSRVFSTMTHAEYSRDK
jgi:MFS family permease